MDDSRSAPSKSQSNADLLKKAVDDNRYVQFPKHFNFNLKLFSLNEYDLGEAEPGPSNNITFDHSNITKDWGKIKALPKSDQISLDQLSFTLKEQLSKYHLTIDNIYIIYCKANWQF